MVWVDLRNSKKAFKNEIMGNFESLYNGNARVVTTAQRLALSPTIGAVCYDSSVTSMFQYNGTSWVQIG